MASIDSPSIKQSDTIFAKDDDAMKLSSVLKKLVSERKSATFGDAADVHRGAARSLAVAVVVVERASLVLAASSSAMSECDSEPVLVAMPSTGAFAVKSGSVSAAAAVVLALVLM